MIRRFLILGLCLAPLVSGWAAPSPERAPEPRRLVKANVLPLALEDGFEFRKQQLLLNDPQFIKPTRDKMVAFEHDRLNYGAVSSDERRERMGNYFRFWWRASRPANLTVRLEYRQANLGGYVQAQEIDVNVPKGTHETKFQVVGDDYLKDGRVTAWRALLIENGRIVALSQSYLWH